MLWVSVSDQVLMELQILAVTWRRDMIDLVLGQSSLAVFHNVCDVTGNVPGTSGNRNVSKQRPSKVVCMILAVSCHAKPRRPDRKQLSESSTLTRQRHHSSLALPCLQKNSLSFYWSANEHVVQFVTDGKNILLSFFNATSLARCCPLW